MDTVFRRLTVLWLLFALSASAVACVKSPQFNPTIKYGDGGALCSAWRASVTHGIDTARVSSVVPDSAGGCGAEIVEYGSVVAYSSIDVVQIACDPNVCPSADAILGAQMTRELTNLTAAGAKAAALDIFAGKGAACIDSCVVKYGTGHCGGVGDKWTCEIDGGVPTSVMCNTSGVTKTGLFTSEGFQLKPYASGDGGYGDNPQPLPPPKGKCPGTVNGVTLYVSCDSSIGSTSATSSVAAGSKTATTTSQTDSTCSNGTCTSVTTGTTTVVNPDGSTTTQALTPTTFTDVVAEHCKAYPNDVVCADKKTSVFGGSCSTNFTCDGDAAQCATAVATNKLNCALGDALKVDVTNAAYMDGAGAMGAGDPSDHPAKNKSVFDIAAFNQDNPFGATCPSDQTVSLGGGMGSLVIPLSSACSVFQMMGALLVGLTLLASAMFVIRGT